MKHPEEGIGKTWFVDLDGTVLEHQSNARLDEMIAAGGDAYKKEKALPGAIEFFQSLPKRDKIIITTARLNEHIDHTLKVLDNVGMPWDDYVFEVQSGPRVVVNDIKPEGLCGNKNKLDTAYAINVLRDAPNAISPLAEIIENKVQEQITGTDNNPEQLLTENNGAFC